MNIEELKKESNYTKTENGATTYLSTNSYCLDLFSTIGAIRNANENDIVDRFIRAYAENRELAMKILFFARDVRGGLGERKVFRVIMKWLADNEPMSVRRNLDNIAEFGRYDDLLSLFGTQCEDKTIAYIKMLLDKDLKALKNGEEVSLLAKWLPSINASNWDTIAKAKLLADELNMSPAEYRKTLTKLRKEISIIENRLREKDYTFDYEKQPSKAMFKYRKAFIRNDKERYDNFLNKVTLGEAVLKTGALAPYEIIQPVIESYCGRLKKQDRKSIATTWEALEDFGSEEDAIVVVDGSGSMYSNSLVNYISFISQLKLFKLLILVNSQSFFSKNELEEIIKIASYKNIKLLLIDNKINNNFDNNIAKIDNDGYLFYEKS